MAFREKMSGVWTKAIAAMVVCAAGSMAQAAIISYGNFSGADVDYIAVTESSGTDAVPLFDTPAIITNSLDFDPKSFVSYASNGTADVTDGQLNFDIVAHAGKGITNVTLNERGDYTLVETGTASTSVNAGAVVFVKITEINNIPLAGNQIISIPAVNATYHDALPGAEVSTPWKFPLGLHVNVAAALGPNQTATRVQVVLNNTLTSTSEASTLAFIAKKDFVVDTDVTVPEPAALGMLAIAGLALLRQRRVD
ncbi:MAG: PEP-CTERM sorting domain-containing protein [Phycisphaerales bacterium]|nr:PEP-CTERM sorting domain-containing protein [Phycisphaerales bacterium]